MTKGQDLGPQARAVLEVIAADPFVSQSEIARRLSLARSTVAAHIVSLVHKGHLLGRAYVLPKSASIVALGGSTVDRKYRASEPVTLETSNPVTGRQSFGGVARNVCENLARLHVGVSLLSCVGDDDPGRSLIETLRLAGVDTSGIRLHPELATAEYFALIDTDGALRVGAADMGIFETLTPGFLDAAWPRVASASWVFADCNPTADLLAELVSRRKGARFKLAVDAVSTTKVRRLPADLAGVDLLFLNEDEARAYLGRPALPAEDAAAALRQRGAECVVVSLGSRGALMANAEGIDLCRAYPARQVDATGAGDALIAGMLSSLLSGHEQATALRSGCLLASLTVSSDASVHQELSPAFFKQALAANDIRS